ncbi:MAG: cytochrome c oxidase subunit II [Actinobacteria bacterium]|nr:cytochrome c oxidase subunit II [Actinomycetota bacterium]
MSDATPNADAPEQADGVPGEPKTAAELIRKPMPWGVRIFGFVACLIVTWVFVQQAYDWFQTQGKPLDTLNPQGPNAITIQNLVNPVFAIAAVVGVVVIGAVVVIAITYRERPGDDDEEFVKQTEGNTTFEIAWTLAPAILLAVIGFFTVVTIQQLEKPAPDAMKVDVFGQQWWWGFRYHVGADGQPIRGGQAGEFPADSVDDVVTANELVVPVGSEVSLRITSNDVIHSYWIPALNGKKDAVPGMYTYWKIQGDKPGVYLGQCTEFCGLSHANMRMVVRVVQPDEFATWLANQRKPARDLEKDPTADPKAVEGQKLFKSLLCASCHAVRGINDAKVAGLEEVGGKKQPGVKDLEVSGQAPDLTKFSTRGMFAGSIFNSRYPDKVNPDQAPEGSPPYRLYQSTCTPDGLSQCGDPRDASNPGNPANPFYTPALAAWLRDPGKQKPMANTPEQNPYANGPNTTNDLKMRGMPNLGLTEEQISQLIAYLETLN